MNNGFLDALNNKIEEAESNYNKAREAAIDELKPNVHLYNDFGAAYVTHIDHVTRYATELKTLHEVKRTYLFFNKEE